MKLAFNRKSDSELRMQFQPFPLVFPLIVLAFFFSLFRCRFSHMKFASCHFHPVVCRPGDYNTPPTGIGQIRSSTYLLYCDSPYGSFHTQAWGNFPLISHNQQSIWTPFPTDLLLIGILVVFGFLLL